MLPQEDDDKPEMMKVEQKKRERERRENGANKDTTIYQISISILYVQRSAFSTAVNLHHLTARMSLTLVSLYKPSGF